MRKPELWIIAGVNGSGKSTFIEKFNRKNIPIVNPDIIALQISKEDTTLRNAKAGRQAIEQRRALLKNKKDFGVETTLTGNSPLKLIAEAKNHGYKVNIVYLGLDTFELSRDRVDARVEAGGHNIPSEDIMRRYPKSFENLKQVLKEVDNAYIFNNSGECRQKVFILNKEKISYIGSNLQPWAQDILQSCIELGYKPKEFTYLETRKIQDAKDINESRIRIYDARNAEGITVTENKGNDTPLSRQDMQNSDPYIDKNTGILKNLVGASTQDALDQKEAEYSHARLAQLEAKPIKGKFDLKHMQALHKQIFQDVYPFAGKIRFVDIVKGNTRFAHNGQIDSQFQKLSDELKKEDYLKGTTPEKFAERAAYYMGEINMLHPFREGNGRTQRAFIGELARNAGHKIDWKQIQDKKQEMVNASIHAVNMNYKPLAGLIQAAMPQGSQTAEQTQTQAKSSRLKR